MWTVVERREGGMEKWVIVWRSTRDENGTKTVIIQKPFLTFFFDCK
jgi:hypothetical protein